MKLASAPADDQYWMVASDGGIFSMPAGVTPFWGSQGYHRLNQPIVGMAATPDGGGYWMVARDGGIFAEGDAGFYGSLVGSPVSAPIVGMAATPDGHGYWIVGQDGNVYARGDATDFGNETYHHLNLPVVGMAATPDGGGYWLVASDGGIFTHGDAPYLGGEGYHHLNQPVVGMAASPDGKGYWLVAADGGIFTEGPIGFYGSEGYHHLNQPVVGMAATPTGRGYWMVAADGGIFSHGDANFGGSEGGTHLNQPVVGMAAVPELFAGTVSLTSTAGSIVADGVSTSTITATVRAADPTAIPGRTVAFSTTTPGCGTVNPSRGVTDLNGSVSTTYTSSTQLGGCSVQATDVNSPSASNTTVITQTAGAAMHLAAAPSGASNPTADQGDAGIPFSFTVTDNLGHPVANTALDLTTTLGSALVDTSPSPSILDAVPFSGNVIPVTTDGTGTAAATLYDTAAGDTGAVTATVHGTGIAKPTGTMTFQAGAFKILSIPQTPATQTAGSLYTVAVDATDAYGNTVNPDTSLLVPGGSALDTALDGTTQATGVWEGPFSDGEGRLDVTSYKAEQAVLSVTDSNDNTITTSTDPYTVGASTFAVLTKPAVSGQTAGQAYSVPVDAGDQWLNPVNPDTSLLVPGGSALDTAPDGTTPGTATWDPAGFSGGEALLHVTSYNAEQAVLSITDSNDHTITTTTDAYTVSAGAFKQLGKPTVGSQTAGTGYKVTVDAFDQWLNAVNPATSGLTVTGSALDTAPDTTSVGTEAWEPAGFSGGSALLDVTSYKAEQAVITITDSADHTITTTTSAFTVSPAALHSMTLGTPSPTSPTAGQQYTLSLSAFDQYLNPASPSSDTIKFTGTALDIAPDSNPNHTGTAAAATFTNGVSTVTATAYEAGSEDLTANYPANSPTVQSNKQTFTVKDSGYAAIVPSYGGGSSFVRLDPGSTPTLLITKPPTGTPAPTSAMITLTPVDQFDNTSSSTDALTTALNPDISTTPDGGMLANGAPPASPDFVAGHGVTITAAESFATPPATYTYDPPSTFPATGAGTIVTTDSTKGFSSTVNVVVTTVSQLLVHSSLTCTTCTAGTGDGITYLAQDANGSAVSGAWLDLTHPGLTSATILPTSPAQTDANGLLAATLNDNAAPEAGTLVATLHDTATSDPNLSLTSSTISYQPGAPTQLWISKSNVAGHAKDGGPTSETAGTPYVLYVWSLDQFNNPVNPTGTVTVNGTALDGVTGGGSSSHSVGSFTNGVATLDVTSAKANAMATLTPAATCGGSPCTQNGVTFAINPGAPASVTGSLTPTGGSYTADQGHTGIAANFLVDDADGNPVPSVQVDVTKTIGLTGNLSAASANTGTTGPALGVATVTLTDTVAGDTGTVTGTVHTTTVAGPTPTITITPGFIHTLSFGAVAGQVAGTGYTVTVTAKDTYNNAVNPAWSELALTGSALFTSTAPSSTGAMLTTNAFSGGSSLVDITSYLAQVAGPTMSVHQLSVACTNAATTAGDCDSITAPTANVDFAISPAAASQLVVRDSHGNVPSSENVTSSSPVNFTIKLEDQYNNAVTTQTGMVDIVLTPGTTSDQGFLSGGGSFTPPDTVAAQTLVLDLSKATSFSYTAPGSLPVNGSGSLTFTDQTTPYPSDPTSLPITD